LVPGSSPGGPTSSPSLPFDSPTGVANQIEGNHTENIGKNLKTDIQENETWEVHENFVFKVDGTRKDTRVENVKEYYLAESKFEYTLEHTDLHHKKNHQINPTVTFEMLNIEGEYKNIDVAIKASAV
jgi:hypothetical protein